jgi:transposase
MGTDRATAATSQTRRPTTHGGSARGGQRHLLFGAERLFLADAAARFSAVGDSALLFPLLAAGWNLGTDPRSVASPGTRGGGAGSQPQCWDHRQPNREDNGKGGPRGYDAAKKVKGRKRHIVVDTIGLILAVVVHAADLQDQDGAELVLARLIGRFPRLQLIWADGDYGGKLVQWACTFGGWLLEIVKRSEEDRGFVLPRRWVVERTFAWLGRHRRLSKDYEALTETSEAMIYIAMIQLMLRRLAPT